MIQAHSIIFFDCSVIVALLAAGACRAVSLFVLVLEQGAVPLRYPHFRPPLNAPHASGLAVPAVGSGWGKISRDVTKIFTASHPGVPALKLKLKSEPFDRSIRSARRAP